ncbi:MAG: recombinase family protein [Vulcanimicrobiaceae bacterium]|jgi:DNA invertase Pin-like site-specific DNA recombinase
MVSEVYDDAESSRLIPGLAPTAWAYLVVSSELQAGTLKHQEDWAVRTASTNGWTITEKFKDHSSGRDGIRRLLETLLAKLEATPKSQRPGRILMIRIDRLGRGLGLENIEALARLHRLGVTIHTRDDGDVRLAKASDTLMPILKSIVAGLENEARRDKAKAVIERRRRLGQAPTNKRPYGLCLDENRHDVPDEPRAAVVRLAFELACNGFGYQAIARRIAKIAPQARYKNGRAYDVNWTGDRVRRLLNTKSYCGTLVDELTWHRAHALKYHIRSKSRHQWPFAGALRCTCGRMLIGSFRGSPPQQVYRCYAVGTHGRNLLIAASVVEAQFIDLLRRLRADPKLIESYAALPGSSRAKLRTLDARIVELRRQLTTIAGEREHCWQLNRSGHIRDGDLQARLDEIATKERQIKNDLRDTERERSQLNAQREERTRADALVRNAAQSWSLATTEERRRLSQALSRALGGLVVGPDRTLRISDRVDRPSQRA